MNVLQILRLLATRGHYSIDIMVGWIVAVYVSNPAEKIGRWYSSATREELSEALHSQTTNATASMVFERMIRLDDNLRTTTYIGSSREQERNLPTPPLRLAADAATEEAQRLHRAAAGVASETTQRLHKVASAGEQRLRRAATTAQEEVWQAANSGQQRLRTAFKEAEQVVVRRSQRRQN